MTTATVTMTVKASTGRTRTAKSGTNHRSDGSVSRMNNARRSWSTADSVISKDHLAQVRRLCIQSISNALRPPSPYPSPSHPRNRRSTPVSQHSAVDLRRTWWLATLRTWKLSNFGCPSTEQEKNWRGKSLFWMSGTDASRISLGNMQRRSRPLLMLSSAASSVIIQSGGSKHRSIPLVLETRTCIDLWGSLSCRSGRSKIGERTMSGTS